MPNVLEAQKSFWMHSMVPLVDEAQMESRFGPLEDRANLDARLEHGLLRTYHWFRNCIGRTRWNALVTWVIWTLASFHLETLLVSMLDRCTVCVERTIGSEIILDAPDGTPR